MKCIICQRNLDYFQSVSKVSIYQCKKCYLTFIDNKKISKLKLNKIYSVKNYSKNELLLSERFEKITSIIMKFKTKGRLLDIGAGLGLFAEVISKFNKYNIYLLEPKQKIKYFNKTNIYKIKLENFLKSKHKKYDIVSMFDVIEHFTDPKRNLINLKKIINKKSILVIQTPNYMSVMAKICRNWSWWMVEDHKFLFSPKSIKLILKITGYKIKYFSTYEDYIDFKKNLDGNFTNINNTLMRKTIKALYFALFIPIYFIFKNLLWKFEYGGLMFIIASKEK